MKKFALHEAVLHSDTEKIGIAIVNGADLDELDDLGNSPMHWAVLRGDYEAVEQLLVAGANPNVIAADGISPKWSAADFGLNDIMILLSTYGGKILTNDKFDRTSWTVFKDFLREDIPRDED